MRTAGSLRSKRPGSISTRKTLMATCAYCNRSGWLLSLTGNGLCHSCDPVVALEVSERARLIRESESIINASTKLETVMSRADFIIDQLKALTLLEEKGVPTVNPRPAELLRRWRPRRDQLICDNLQKTFEDTRKKIATAVSSKTAISALSKVLLRVRDYKSKLLGETSLKGLESAVLKAIHATQLRAYLEAARKADFKGQKKRLSILTMMRFISYVTMTSRMTSKKTPSGKSKQR